MANEGLVLDGDAFADEGVALDLAVPADGGIFLDFHESPDLGAVADGAAIQVDEFGELDIFNIVKNVDDTTDIVTLKISDEAARIGLKIIDAVFEGVKIPEEARRFASGVGSQAMTMQYMKETATELKGSEGGGAAAAGLGAGMRSPVRRAPGLPGGRQVPARSAGGAGAFPEEPHTGPGEASVPGDP